MSDLETLKAQIENEDCCWHCGRLAPAADPHDCPRPHPGVARLLEQRSTLLAALKQHEATITELEAKKCRTWAQGIVWAAAELVRAHGVDTYAEWLLRLGVEAADLPGCAEEDLSVLREAFPTRKIPRGLE